MPHDFLRVFNRDLKAAGIPKIRDGKHMDLHALRTTTTSHSTSKGIVPCIARQFMRHSTYDWTANVYTDPQRFDLTAALDALPKMRGESRDDSQPAAAS